MSRTNRCRKSNGKRSGLRHYHEFEDWQFDWLLEKSNWEIEKKEKWTSPIKKIGFRPILRKFTPRYYIVYATKSVKS